MDHKPKELLVQSIDEGYTRNVGYGFNTAATVYATRKEVWAALEKEPNTAVFSASLAPTRSDVAPGEQEPPLYAASLLTISLPVQGASKIYPAEALRYE
jgi:hypothetical protein